jgi:hypothetical protein
MKDRQYIGFIGIIVSVVGWFVLSADHFPMVYRIFAPQYGHALSALEKMQEKNHILKREDMGFSEVAQIIEILMDRDFVPKIVRIRTLAAGQGSIKGREGMELVDYTRLEVYFADSETEIWEVGGLERAVKKRYLTLDVFLWGSVIVGVGMVLMILSVLMKEEDRQKTH